jgi:hypothetical protein
MRRPATPQELRFPIAPRAVVAVLAAMVAALTVLSVAAVVYKYEIEPGPHREMMRIANLDEEGGLQAWYQSSTLLLCGVLMFLIALVRRRDGAAYVRHWAILGVVFACLAVDEAAKLHELTISPLQDRLDAGGVLYYTWIVPAALILLVLGASYLGFLRNLAPRTRALFLTAAALYIGGAMGFEAVNGLYVDQHGNDTLVYALLTNLEEVLEMTGVLVLLSALMSELAVPAAVESREVAGSDSARAAVAAGSR